SQAIRKSYDMGWHPQQFVGSIAASVAASLKPAGLEKSIGVISASHLRDPTDAFTIFGYSVAMAVTEALRRCGDDLTRENLLKVMTHFSKFRVPVLTPGASITITPTDYESIKQLRLRRFDGKVWRSFGDLIEE